MNKQVAVIGSGFAAWGAVQALKSSSDVRITVFDIGLLAPNKQTEIEVPNAKRFRGSFFGYGINDKDYPVELKSDRMCSSHCYGGHSTVYSGSILYPKSCDLIGWPDASKPRPQDYAAILEKLPLKHAVDELSSIFPIIPDERVLSGSDDAGDITALGASRIAFAPNSNVDNNGIFSLQSEFEAFIKAGEIDYRGNHYVREVSRQGGQLTVLSDEHNRTTEETFDAVFIGAGCVNTTAIVDRSLHGTGTREYKVCSPSMSIQAFISTKKNYPAEILERQSTNHPEFFLEIRSSKTGNAWSHTQLTRINSQIIEAIKSRLPRALHIAPSLLQKFIYFSLSGANTKKQPLATIISTVEPDSEKGASQTLTIREECSDSDPSLSKAVRAGVLSNWKRLGMIPFPFGSALANFFRGNRLGGWHFGGTLPMGTEKLKGSFCDANAELIGLPQAFVIDSSAFPTVPASTVALLTATHAYRVARKWSHTIEESGS